MSVSQDFIRKITLLKGRKLGLTLDDSHPRARCILFAPAEEISYENVNSAITLSANNLFVALSPERTSALLLSPMARPSTAVGNAGPSMHDLNMCVSVEAREGVTTGISAQDRTHTIRVLGERLPSPRKLVKPGHIFPVEVREGGVLVNHALPEGALDIVKLAGFSDAALFSDLLNSKGDFCAFAEASEIAVKYELPVFTLSELTQYRLQNEILITRMAEAKLPTRYAGELKAVIYKSKIHEGEHLALVKGKIRSDQPVLTRIQLEYTFGDVFGGDNPPSKRFIVRSLQAIGGRENGVLIHLRRPFRGILREQVRDWGEFSREHGASMIREYGIGSQILLDLGARKVELLTNSPRDYSGVKSFGIEIVSQLPLKDN